MTTEQKTLADFIAKAGITLEYTKTFGNPNADGWAKDANHWSVKLIRTVDGKRRELVTPYSKGAGLVVRLPNGQPKRSLSWDARTGERKPIPEPPQADEVLNSLSLDSSSVENAGSFEEWARDLGYDEDSRKAEAIFRVCFDQARALRAFLGETLYNELLYNTESL